MKKQAKVSPKTLSTQKSPKNHQIPKRKRKPINWQTVRYVIFLLVWVALSMVISQFIIGLPMLWILGDNFEQPFWTCIYYGLTYILSLALIIFLPPKIIQKLRQTQYTKLSSESKTSLPNLSTSREELGLRDLPTVIDVGLAPIAYFVYLIISYVLTSAMSVFTWFDAKEAQNVGFGYFISSRDRIIAMIALVFIAPIAEEIIMRGWLYGKLRTKLKIPLAILLTSLLFAILHGQWNVSVGVFALSLVLCGLREITGTIWSGILLHMLSNGVAFYLLYIAF